jgi:hypothetical protein
VLADGQRKEDVGQSSSVIEELLTWVFALVPYEKKNNFHSVQALVHVLSLVKYQFGMKNECHKFSCLFKKFLDHFFGSSYYLS